MVAALDRAHTMAPAPATTARQVRGDLEATAVDAIEPVLAGAVRRVASVIFARSIHTRPAGIAAVPAARDGTPSAAAGPPRGAGVATGGTVRRVGLKVGAHAVAAALPAGARTALECPATAIADHAALAGVAGRLRRAAVARRANLIVVAGVIADPAIPRIGLAIGADIAAARQVFAATFARRLAAMLLDAARPSAADVSGSAARRAAADLSGSARRPTLPAVRRSRS